ncbi:hypothetical protein ACTXT7_007681 [Hymenolepis weldensis]
MLEGFSRVQRKYSIWHPNSSSDQGKDREQKCFRYRVFIGIIVLQLTEEVSTSDWRSPKLLQMPARLAGCFNVHLPSPHPSLLQ